MQDHEKDDHNNKTRLVQDIEHLCTRFSRGLEDNSTPDLDCVVCEALVVPAEQGHIYGGGDAVFPLSVHKHREKMSVQVVHVVVVIVEFGCSVGVF